MITYPEHFVPVDAILDQGTWVRRPKHVRSITAVLSTAEKEPIELVEGYNMKLTFSDEIVEGNRVKHQVTFDAESGNGMGIYPGCQPRPLVITKINDIAPTAAGDFYMAATDCYWIRRPITLTGSNTGEAIPAMLQLGNDCGPCCQCSQFVATGKYMNRVRDQYDALGTEAERVRDQYHANRNRWNVGKCCFDQHLLRLQMQAQLCPHLDVLGQFCNWTDECVGPLKMMFDFSNTATVVINETEVTPNAIVVPGFTNCRGSVRMEYRRAPRITRCNIGGVWPFFEYTFTEVEPYQNVWIKFRLFFESCGIDDDTNPFAISCCLRATIDGVPLNVPCGGELPSSDSSAESASSVSGSSAAWSGFEICKVEELQCPPQVNDLYNPSVCFSKGQIFDAIGRT